MAKAKYIKRLEIMFSNWGNYGPQGGCIVDLEDGTSESEYIDFATDVESFIEDRSFRFNNGSEVSIVVPTSSMDVAKVFKFDKCESDFSPLGFEGTVVYQGSMKDLAKLIPKNYDSGISAYEQGLRSVVSDSLDVCKTLHKEHTFVKTNTRKLPPDIEDVYTAEMAKQDDEHIAGSDGWQGDCYESFV